MEVAARYKLLTLLFTVNTEGRFPEKKTAVLLDFVEIWTTCTNFFRRRNSRFESKLRTKNTMYYYNIRDI